MLLPPSPPEAVGLKAGEGSETEAVRRSPFFSLSFSSLLDPSPLFCVSVVPDKRKVTDQNCAVSLFRDRAARLRGANELNNPIAGSLFSLFLFLTTPSLERARAQP